MLPRPTVVRVITVATAAFGVGVWLGAVAVEWPFAGAAAFAVAVLLGVGASAVESERGPGGHRPGAATVEAFTLACLEIGRAHV